jgi:hypothetical protein
MVKKQINKKKIYSKKRVLRGGEINTTAFIDGDGIHGITKTGFWVDKEKEIEKLTEEVCGTWFSNLRDHPNFDTGAFNADGSVKGTTNGLENIAICESILKDKYDDKLQKLPLESVDDSAGTGVDDDDDDYDYVVVPKEQPGSSIEETEMPSECEELKRILTLMYENIITIIKKRNNGYITKSVIQQVKEVFDICAEELVTSIQTSTIKFTPKICKEISELCKFLVFKTLVPSSGKQRLISKTHKPIGFFIGIEKHNSSGLFDSDCDSLKLFDNFLNSLIDRINKYNIVIDGFSGYTPRKRLFLVLLKVGGKYTSSMTRCGITKINLSPGIARDFLDSGLPEDVYNSLPYDFSGVGAQQESDVPVEAGGSKSRRRYRRHRKPARKTRRGRKSKPKTHRRRNACKNKKYTRKL